MAIIPKSKPKNYSKILDILNTKAAANTLSPQTYINLVGEYSRKAYDNNEISRQEYMDIVKPLFGETGVMATKAIENYRKKFRGGGMDMGAGSSKSSKSSGPAGGASSGGNYGGNKNSGPDRSKVSAQQERNHQAAVREAQAVNQKKEETINRIKEAQVKQSPIRTFFDHANFTKGLKRVGSIPNYHQLGGYDFMSRFPNTPPSIAKFLGYGYQGLSEGIRSLNPFDNYSFQDAMTRAGEEGRLNALGVDAYGNPTNPITQQYYNLPTTLRPNFAKGGNYWSMVTRKFIEAGGEKKTGMSINEFAQQYFPKMAQGGRIGYQEGKLAQLGNIVDVKNIPYYASKTVEGAVNAGEVLSKLPFAAGNLVSRLLREKPNKEMFLSALNDIQPGSFSEAIGLSDVIARQEENLSPETKTAGSQLSLTSETFIPVGAAINLGNKIIKTASTKLGKDGPKLEKLIDEQLTAKGESRRDFNKMVATTGLFAALKALGITGLAGKTAAKTADFRVKMFGDMDVADNFTDIGNEPTAVNSLSTYIQPLTKKGKEILEKFNAKNSAKSQKEQLTFKIDKDGEYVFSDGENALTAIEDIKKYSDNFELETPVRVSKKPGAPSWEQVTENKIFRPGENYADDVINENSTLSYDTGNPYTNNPFEYVDEFAEDIINTVLPKKVKKASGGRVRYGIDTLEESKDFGYPDD